MKNTQALVSDGRFVSLFGFQGAGSRIPNSNQSPAKRVLLGEEEQGSGRSFRRQAEAELSGLCDDEDGGLIGGASLKPADFVEIINSANQE